MNTSNKTNTRSLKTKLNAGSVLLATVVLLNLAGISAQAQTNSKQNFSKPQNSKAMYIRMINFQTTGNKKAEAVLIMNTLIPKIKEQKGCKDCLFIMHESDNHYALLVFWDSQENANAAAVVIGPLMIPALNKISTEPVNPQLYQVYQN